MATKHRRGRQPPPRILICLPLADGFTTQVAQGISEYSHQFGRWDMMVIKNIDEQSCDLSIYSDVAGIIAMPISTDNAKILTETNLPVVLTRDQDFGDLPRVGPNDVQVGRMALDYFLTKGFRRVAYCGSVTAMPSKLRRDALLQEAQRSGVDSYAFNENVFASMEQYPDMSGHFCQWLRELPKPIGLLVFCDSVALTVIHFCRTLNIMVPEEIALLSVDNDVLMCEMTTPRLSSIDHGAHRIGYEAASILDSMMHGCDPPRKPILVDPIGVVERQSSNTMAVDNPDLLAAMTFIRQYAHDGIGVEDVLEEVPLSRRVLERGFQHALGRTVHQEILRIRVDAAKHLLLNTNMMFPDIARRCGFGRNTQLSKVFKRVTGLSPRQFRRKFQVGTDD